LSRRIGRGAAVLIHGSVGNADSAWAPVGPLENRFEVVTTEPRRLPAETAAGADRLRPAGDELAPLLGGGAHLVGHSYGGVIALLIAAANPERVRSLAVSEPPAFGLARGTPSVDELGRAAGRALRATGPREPRAFAEGFLAARRQRERLPERLPPGSSSGIRDAWPSARPGRRRSRSTSSPRRPFPSS
jgi:pimeloyl-ACP methyl ester carboxylesterase